jgi:hypothetical protein
MASVEPPLGEKYTSVVPVDEKDSLLQGVERARITRVPRR